MTSRRFPTTRPTPAVNQPLAANRAQRQHQRRLKPQRLIRERRLPQPRFAEVLLAIDERHAERLDRQRRLLVDHLVEPLEAPERPLEVDDGHLTAHHLKNGKRHELAVDEERCPTLIERPQMPEREVERRHLPFERVVDDRRLLGDDLSHQRATSLRHSGVERFDPPLVEATGLRDQVALLRQALAPEVGEVLGPIDVIRALTALFAGEVAGNGRVRLQKRRTDANDAQRIRQGPARLQKRRRVRVRDAPNRLQKMPLARLGIAERKDEPRAGLVEVEGVVKRAVPGRQRREGEAGERLRIRAQNGLDERLIREFERFEAEPEKIEFVCAEHGLRRSAAHAVPPPLMSLLKSSPGLSRRHQRSPRNL